MNGGGGAHPLPVVLIDNDGAIRRFVLRSGEKEVVRGGRAPKHDVVFNLAGVSSNHFELRLLSSPPDEHGNQVEKPQLGVRDMSMNGTGLRQPGCLMERLPKDVDTLVQDGALLMVPMRIDSRKEGALRMCWSIHFGDVNEELLKAPELPAQVAVAVPQDPAVASNGKLAGSVPVPDPAAPPLARAKAAGSRKKGEKDGEASEEPESSKRRRTTADEQTPEGFPPVKTFPKSKPPRRQPPASDGPDSLEASVGAESRPVHLQSKLERGETLIREGRVSEDNNELSEAYEGYQQGLKFVLEVLLQLADDDPLKSRLQQQVSIYLERASKLKDRLRKQ
eukprot:gnl/TRDRNA2_/TRDRNA2_172918_c0_seq1.p1 gnl/TRDRNA2_/TRDRNA2_172918_c0~~gnl/TRDRNA2_/TRDRNA2_172918_c0_seq1.p1  ORF type:complete len:336 (-),score=84.35 gnl/TRDRNA2_/TRDRNA2_172918_c0_seq1:26-1033(-)